MLKLIFHNAPLYSLYNKCFLNSAINSHHTVHLYYYQFKSVFYE
ncbi:hypothetical protein PROSTU_03454 [Providencia stuartii ATCC 25827]|uniref:Uncharacterized protein n=1 Tax=Providencia stuartii ATCC 25827 TaxID=471874 RepID=A0AA86YY29_PROST|nr:hypothetical protein PROSTU_03454 [Providencia stuartii ATCC 25827]